MEKSALVPLVTNVFEKRNDFLSLTYPGQKLSSNSTHKKMTITGLIKIDMAQSRAFRLQFIADAFSEIGARPYSVTQILSQYSASIDRAMKNLIMKEVEEL